MSKAKHNVVSYSKVDNSKIDFTELEVSDRANGQSNAYVRYKCEKNGERQFDIQTPVIKMEFQEVDELPDTIRGEGGFGSTGK